jgi:hypothetical protein
MLGEYYFGYQYFQKSSRYWLTLFNKNNEFPKRIYKKSMYKIILYIVPSDHISFHLNKWACLTKQTTHVDVIRSPHIDKKSREQFNKVYRKYIKTTSLAYPYFWLAKCLNPQSRAINIKIMEKQKVLFTSNF